MNRKPVTPVIVQPPLMPGQMMPGQIMQPPLMPGQVLMPGQAVMPGPSDSISFWSADCGTGVSVSHGCCPKYANAEPAVQQCYLSSSEPADTSNPYNKSNAVSVVLLFVVIRLTMDVERKIHIRKRRRRFDIRGFLISFP